MLQKIIAGILTIGYCLPCIVIANTCPSIANVKARQLNGWKAYDSQNNRLLTSVSLKRFSQNAQTFSLAELAQNGTLHCYYHDKNGSDLEAYLAKAPFIKVSPTHALHAYWYPVSGFLHCAASESKCQFSPMPLRPSQFAVYTQHQ